MFLTEDLISLLDAGIHIEHPSVIVDADVIFNEDMFGYSSLRARAGSRSRTASKFSVMFTGVMYCFAKSLARWYPQKFVCLLHNNTLQNTDKKNFNL